MPRVSCPFCLVGPDDECSDGCPSRTPIESVRDLPADGCITVRAWDRTRGRGWHVERVEAEYDGSAWVTASPMSATSGAITGAPRRVQLRFELDAIEPMP